MLGAGETPKKLSGNACPGDKGRIAASSVELENCLN